MGGTALNRIYLKQKRFSEDLDFDFISKKNLSQKKVIINKMMKQIKEFEVQRPRRMREVVRYDCQYLNVFGERDKIGAEFNLEYKNLIAAKKPEKAISIRDSMR